MSQIKIGSQVIVIDAEETDLKLGEVYEVASFDALTYEESTFIRIKKGGRSRGYYKSRFANAKNYIVSQIIKDL